VTKKQKCYPLLCEFYFVSDGGNRHYRDSHFKSSQNFFQFDKMLSVKNTE
jgi:hypothetical protein